MRSKRLEQSTKQLENAQNGDIRRHMQRAYSPPGTRSTGRKLDRFIEIDHVSDIISHRLKCSSFTFISSKPLALIEVDEKKFLMYNFSQWFGRNTDLVEENILSLNSSFTSTISTVSGSSSNSNKSSSFSSTSTIDSSVLALAKRPIKFIINKNNEAFSRIEEISSDEEEKKDGEKGDGETTIDDSIIDESVKWDEIIPIGETRKLSRQHFELIYLPVLNSLNNSSMLLRCFGKNGIMVNNTQLDAGENMWLPNESVITFFCFDGKVRIKVLIDLKNNKEDSVKMDFFEDSFLPMSTSTSFCRSSVRSIESSENLNTVTPSSSVTDTIPKDILLNNRGRVPIVVTSKTCRNKRKTDDAKFLIDQEPKKAKIGEIVQFSSKENTSTEVSDESSKKEDDSDSSNKTNNNSDESSKKDDSSRSGSSNGSEEQDDTKNSEYSKESGDTNDEQSSKQSDSNGEEKNDTNEEKMETEVEGQFSDDEDDVIPEVESTLKSTERNDENSSKNLRVDNLSDDENSLNNSNFSRSSSLVDLHNNNGNNFETDGNDLAIDGPPGSDSTNENGEKMSGSKNKKNGGSKSKKRQIFRYDVNGEGIIRPNFSYAQLIEEAITSAVNQRMTLAMIYNYIQTNYVYYKNGDKGWQNSIRHNLSLNPIFRRIDRGQNAVGKGAFWRISWSTKEFLRIRRSAKEKERKRILENKKNGQPGKMRKLIEEQQKENEPMGNKSSEFSSLDGETPSKKISTKKDSIEIKTKLDRKFNNSEVSSSTPISGELKNDSLKNPLEISNKKTICISNSNNKLATTIIKDDVNSEKKKEELEANLKNGIPIKCSYSIVNYDNMSTAPLSSRVTRSGRCQPTNYKLIHPKMTIRHVTVNNASTITNGLSMNSNSINDDNNKPNDCQVTSSSSSNKTKDESRNCSGGENCENLMTYRNIDQSSNSQVGNRQYYNNGELLGNRSNVHRVQSDHIQQRQSNLFENSHFPSQQPSQGQNGHLYVRNPSNYSREQCCSSSTTSRNSSHRPVPFIRTLPSTDRHYTRTRVPISGREIGNYSNETIRPNYECSYNYSPSNASKQYNTRSVVRGNYRQINPNGIRINDSITGNTSRGFSSGNSQSSFLPLTRTTTMPEISIKPLNCETKPVDDKKDNPK
ncbi:hypothetical protein SNEBB_011119 [Seison nebaliae]|nr:hypothetical protein SNEBB_011119 [Seison nebaliae]